MTELCRCVLCWSDEQEINETRSHQYSSLRDARRFYGHGHGGGIDDDVDAFTTYFLAADASGQPDPEAEYVFQITPDDPNRMVVVDDGALPEPGTSLMLGAEIALLSGLARRRARAKV